MIRKTSLIAAASALSLLSALPTGAQTIAIVGARILSQGPAGDIASGTVLIKDGKIVAVGAKIAVPADARIVDASGKTVSPGLVLPSTSLTVAEVEQIGDTMDDSAGKRMGASFDVQYGVNPNSALIPLARLSGVTRAVVTPVLGRGGSGGHKDDGADDFSGSFEDGEASLFAGQVATATLAAGATDAVVKAKIGMALDLGEAGAAYAGGSRGAAIVLLKSALEDARHYARNRAAFDMGASRPYPYSRDDLEALIPVVEGRMPLLVRVHRASDITQILKFAADQKLKLILEGAEEGWMVADAIAKAAVTVLIDTQADLPGSFETLGSTLQNAGRLNAAGVTVAVMGSRDYNNLRQGRFNAGLAVSYGLPYSAAMASVTLNPAKIWGLADRIGSLEPGKDADVVIWTGDPLEVTTYATSVFIQGKEQPMTSRSLQLAERYRPVKSDYPPAYR
jgi:imidazolonepropionase-like amidohydrolase